MVFKKPGYPSLLSFCKGRFSKNPRILGSWGTLGSALAVGALQLCFVDKANAGIQDLQPAIAPLASEETLGSQIQKKLRIRNFTEFMTPALQGSSSAIPSSDGSDYIPTTLFNIFSADYEITPNYRLLYYQRVFLLLTTNSGFQGMSLFGRDPRFALRRTQIFDVPNLNTSYDLYFQPGISNNQISGGNRFEVGFRTNTNYTPPGTR